jgi:hypothetical protein
VKFLLAYLLIGEAFGLATLYWAWLYNRRFAHRHVNGNWRDLVWVLGIQLFWPIVVPVLGFVLDDIWRTAVQNEVCVCGHSRSQHADAEDWAGRYDRCIHTAVSARFLVAGEGPELIRCQCPKFTLPNVRPRR